MEHEFVSLTLSLSPFLPGSLPPFLPVSLPPSLLLFLPPSLPPFLLPSLSFSAIHRELGLLYFSDIADDVIGVTHLDDSYWTRQDYRNDDGKTIGQSSSRTPIRDFSAPIRNEMLYTVKVGMKL